jgi:hypothetical protein
MGVDYSAHTVIGVELPNVDDLPRLKEKTRKRAFKHSFKDDGEHEFDPKSGKPLWLAETEEVETDEPSVVYDDDNYEGNTLEGQRLLKAPDGMGFCWGTDQESVFLGIVSGTGSDNEEADFMEVPDIEATKMSLKGALDPLGLWDESKFGIYTVLYCSY